MSRGEGGEVGRLLGRRLLLEVAVAQRGSGAQALCRVVHEQLVQQGDSPHRRMREVLHGGSHSVPDDRSPKSPSRHSGYMGIK